jgi:hypothetical protein
VLNDVSNDATFVRNERIGVKTLKIGKPRRFAAKNRRFHSF